MLLLWATASLLPAASACYIQGQDIGTCTSAADLATSLSFCGSLVRYTACVPTEQVAFKANFSHGPTVKDAWVQSTYEAVIAQRIAIETNSAARQRWQALSGETGDVKKRFSGNADCQNAYKNFICWMNFPRCNDEGESLIMCKSVCENYFKSCKYSADMNRCGPPQYYGGASPEPATDLDANGNPLFWRAQYPGQPFRNNVHDNNGQEVPVCTPALTNKALSATVSVGVLIVLLLATAFVLLS